MGLSTPPPNPDLEKQPTPVRAAFLVISGIVTLVVGIFPVLQGFEIINWTGDQMALVVGFLGLFTTTVGGVIGSIWAENRVTPTESPRNDQGLPLVPLDIDAGDEVPPPTVQVETIT